MPIDRIFKYDDLVLQEYRQKRIISREYFQKIDINEKIIGIVWLRWVGKSTFLLQQRIDTSDSIYISCDAWFLWWVDMLGLIEELMQWYDKKVFFLDEIHFLDNRQALLKNIYDFLPIKVVFSGSSMINILKWKYDLSRRVIDYAIPIFSFREFLNMTNNTTIKSISLEDILQNHQKIAAEYIKYFSQTIFERYWKYWQFGYRYESQNQNYTIKLDNSIKKSIYEDLSQVVDISTENLKNIEKLLFFLANTATSECSYNNLSKKVDLSVKTIAIYIEFLEDLWWIKKVPKYGNITDMVRKQEKIYFTNTNIIDLLSQSNNIANYNGIMRESFFVSCLNKLTNDVFWQKNKLYYQSQTDFVLEIDNKKCFFEIGWKWKSRSDQNIFVIKDDITIGQWNNVPLWLFWLL